jgi:YfiH family protein
VHGPNALIEDRGGVRVLTFPVLAGLPADVVITTRYGGVSAAPYDSLNLGLHVGDAAEAVVENRRRAARVVGLDLDDLVFCNQTHGRVVVTVGAADRGRGARRADDAVPGADALVTATPGVGLVVMVADCVPIVLVDPVRRMVACVHAGWRGTTARVAEATVEAMAAGGARPGDLVAAVGPAVPAQRYQVGEDVASAAAECFGPALADVLAPDGTGRWRFDLWAANRRILADAGLAPANVVVAERPTGGGGPWWSDRETRPCGRFAAIAVLH